MEQSLVSKLEEFMTVLDQVKKYKKLLASLTDFAIIIALTIVAVLFVNISSKLALVFVTYTNPSWIPLDNSIEILLVLTGIIGGVYLINKRIKSVKTGQWRTRLNEGAPGAIKLLQELEWDDVFSDIRYAKLGFWLYGILRVAAFWLLAFVSFSFVSGFVGYRIHVNVDNVVVGLFCLILVLALNKKDFSKRYDQVGRLDSLLWELRWFDSEFRRADFKT
jgi:hypothetical protein